MLMFLSLLLPRALGSIGQASNAKDYFGNRNAPPNVIFVIDVHEDMTTKNCFALADTTGPCISEVESALWRVLPRENWARVGIAYTRSSPATADNFTAPTTNYTGAFYGLEPDGQGTAQSIYNAIDFLSTIPADTVNFPIPNPIRNPGESIRKIYLNVLRSATIGDGWTVSPILHSCQDTHIILITTGRPTNSDSATGTLTTMGSGGIRDVCCDDLGNYTSGANSANCLAGAGAPASDYECQLDNVARELWLGDGSAAIAGTQKVRLHTIYLEDSSETALNRTIANELYSNVQTVQSNSYTPPFATSYIRLDESVAGTNSHDLERAIRDTLWFIRDRVVAEDQPSAIEDLLQPKVDTRGKYAAIAWSSLVGETSGSHGEVRDSGHMTFVEVVSDPTSPSYGLFIIPAFVTDVAINEAAREESGLWPQNVDFPRLASLVDMNRNVYTYLSSADAMLTGAQFTAWKNAARMPFDHDLELAIAADASAQKPNWLAGMLGPTVGTDPDELDSDFDGDMDADVNDFSNVIAFAHDWDSAVYRWGYQGGSSTYATFGDDRIPGWGGSIPVLVDYDNATEITSEATYQTFLDLLVTQAYGAFAFIGANDGTLRAYTVTSPGAWWASGAAGYEVFRWIPEGVLARDPAALNNLFPSLPWRGTYIDQLIYGRQLMGGGSVTVRDVWIDSQNTSGQAGFGTKECTALATCEWRRIAVLAREDGGGGILALDITNPYSPTFLREYYGQGSDGVATSRPVVANIFDDSNASSGEHVDRTVLFFGSGRPVDIRNAPKDGTRHAIEPAIRTFAITQTKPTDRTTFTAIADVSSTMPDWGASAPDDTTYDADTEMEFGGIEAPLAVLDTDGDGDADTAYFTLTKTFREVANGGAGVGSAPEYNSEQFPSTSLYKACRETAGEPGEWTYLELADLGATEVYYAPTLSYFADGTLGVFVVTSTPYELDELDYTAMADSATTQQRIYFGYDSDPDGCGGSTFTFTRKDTSVSGSCTSNQYVLLPVGERVVSDPVAFGGYLLLSTFIQGTGVGTTAACSAVTGRVRLFNYETCAASTVGGFTSGIRTLTGYPSNLAITDFGTVLVGTTSGGGASGTMISLNVGLFESVKVLNWMQVF
jgi:hypothetical protein